eukprot:14352909-Heterocapsa_arctica.AAC.1
MAATPAGADRVRQSAERIRAHVARAQERVDGERSSKRQRIAAEGGSTDNIANLVANHGVTLIRRCLTHQQLPGVRRRRG